ncbi:MAG: DUF456 domain-containing protein [Bacteroidales bacterium]|nr:DUF456 domain-containing protein [Candidatus Colimorpha pelethequi]
MDIFLIIMACLCGIIGILGSIIPGLPGPPVSWIGLLLIAISSYGDLSNSFLFIAALIAAIITVLDYVVPSMSTKKFGGSKYGIWGCNIGLVISIVGLPFGPQGLLGVIFWPFIGAFIGELLNHKPTNIALKAAFGAFVGFLTGTLMKLAYGIIALVFIVKDIFV